MAKQLARPADARFDELGIPPAARPASGRASSVVGNISEDMLMMLRCRTRRRKVEEFRLAARDGRALTAEEQLSGPPSRPQNLPVSDLWKA